ncbi:MAG: peptidase dimerization domain-containing protein [Desulfosarcinaceae bacterium]
MTSITDRLPGYVETLRSMMDIIIANIVLIGQIPAPTFEESKRVEYFMQRLAEFQIDECTTDGYGNPIGIIRGSAPHKPPIFVVARMDTPFSREMDHHYMIKQNMIAGPGLLDNSLGLGVALSLPEILRKLDLRCSSDIVLAGVIQSIGRGNLRGIRHLLKTWSTPIRGAVCIESGELGRLNYYSDGMIRCEIVCKVDQAGEPHPGRFRPNAILIINEAINRIVELRVPLKPRSRIIFGTIQGGFKHGEIAQHARLGLEVHSKTDETVRKMYREIQDIVSGIAHENDVTLKLETISNLRTARLRYTHPLVKAVVAAMGKLAITPMSAPSESEVSIFLSRHIPAVTLGVTHGEGYQKSEAKAEIDPMFRGIAQIVGTIMAIDRGVCDE